ncbi:MAG: carbamoyltransferase HypF [Clostridiales Family XIII bacterium]|jgi:hydrogenase maturation protein HypF|nr:carbamoyltransferase HypF [Clostridiales Family XIII bacterium]
MTEKRTELIKIKGVVQGVGFRPTVYRIAQRLGMKGNVRNMGGVVQIAVTDTPSEIDAFVEEILAHKPPMSRIDGILRTTIETADFREFAIAPSAAAEDEISVIPADICICEDCEREFNDPENPRYHHPFISCTNCGPRYTIMERLPYDRDTTTMDDFPMCEFCAGEYTDPGTRLYHAQTISCHNCGPQPICHSRDRAKGEAATAEAIRILRAGGVIALKGVGGYYLVCSPFDAGAVAALRRAKRREEKPFAVMYHGIAHIQNYCRISPEEQTALTSPRRPIVLLEQRPEIADGSPPLAENVCGSSRFVGAFLPSFGLQFLLLDAVGPLIMTSANLSDQPIVTEDGPMFEMAAAAPEIEAVLYHTRRIAAGLDDSVLRVIDGTAQLIRRARGYVPAPILVRLTTPCRPRAVFAAGPHLKSALALSKGSYAYLSQHLGDIDCIESEAVYRETFQRLTEFFGIDPAIVVCDLHPLYFPTRFAEAYAKEREALGRPVRLLYAQHHHAHTLSVVAEHGLTGPVIGVSFDGTGYGTDGAIWGGEILICEGAGFERFSHLKYVRMLGGDASVREGWKSAASHLAALDQPPAADEFEIDLSPYAAYARSCGIFSDNNNFAEAKAAIGSGLGGVTSSSMGRLFDAVASMLGVCHENRYEGECASMLENAAVRGLRGGARNDNERDQLALRFHLDVAHAILDQCTKARAERSVNKVCLSGGVFQNRVLMEETLRLLRADCFDVYYNIHVPPNDGGIALGQIYLGMALHCTS